MSIDNIRKHIIWLNIKSSAITSFIVVAGFFFASNSIFSQSTFWHKWHSKEREREFISLASDQLGPELQYVGSRIIENSFYVMFLDKESIVQSGAYYEATLFQYQRKEGPLKGAFIVTLCDCKNNRINVKYIGSIDGSVGEEKNNGWQAGIGDGFAGRVVSTVCKQKIPGYIYIDLTKSSGVYYLPVKLNGEISKNFILDSGAGDLLVSRKLGNALKNKGLISSKDFIQHKNYRDASGGINKLEVYNLRSVQVGDVIVRNVHCAISNKQNVELLLGQSVLEKLGNYEIDYNSNQLIIK